MSRPSPFELAAAALGCPIETISADSSLNLHPNWDSLGHLEVMMALERHYDIQIVDETVRRFQSMAAIVEYYNGLKEREN